MTAKVTEPREVSSGTLRTADLIEAFLDVLKEINPDAYSDLIAQAQEDGCPCDTWYMDLELHLDWESWVESDPQSADYFLNELLFDAMNEQSGDGLYFGAHEGDGACFGWWRVEVDLIASGYEFMCPSCISINRVVEIRESYRCMYCDALVYTNDYHHAHKGGE